ncbi:O-antigen ligase domain-containing protein [bacterium]|nr:MAG: O-antigen ligase domain-containing protein [bacterium]
MLKVIIIIFPLLFFIILNSWEDSITFQILDYNITFIEICFILMYLIFIIKNDFKIYAKNGIKVLFLINFLVVFFLSRILISVFQETDISIRSLFSLIEVYIPILVLLSIRFDKRTKDLVSWLITIFLILLDIEVIIYSLGIITYTGIYGEFFIEKSLLARIHTTIGAATSTGYMLFFLFLIVFLLSKTKLKILSLFLTVIAIFSTLSRGPIILVCIFSILYFFKDIKSNFCHNRFRRLFNSFILILLLFILLFNLGIPGYISSRFSHSGRAHVSNLERVERFNKAVKNFKYSKNCLFGTGYGSFLPRFRRYKQIDAQHILSYNPHNSFLVLLNEVGLLGIFFILIITFIVIKELYRKNDKVFVTIFLFSILCFLMFETIVFSFRYIYPVVLLLGIQLNSDQES